jgi:hydrogenase maturation protease
MSGRTLVAGVGNVFLRDDAFGVEVIKLLSGRPVPDGVQVKDFGIRGVHLAYDLLDGRHHTVVMVDAVPLDDPPGTLAVLQVDPTGGGAPMDAHGMHPAAVLALLHDLGGSVDRVLVVGCAPADVAERMGLSEPVAAAVDAAVRLIGEVVAAEVGVAAVRN